MTKSKSIRLTELISAIILGAATALYRTSLAKSSGQLLPYGGMDYAKGLLIPLIALCVAAFFAVSFLCFRPQRITDEKNGLPYAFASSLAALGMIATGVIMYIDGGSPARPITIVMAVFLALCGIMLILRGTGRMGAAGSIAHLFPVYLMCLLLLLFYRENAKNPSVFSFALEIITIIAVMLAVYVFSSLSFESPRERQHIFFGLTAVYFVSMLVFCALLYPQLVYSVPGFSRATVMLLCSFGLYIGSGLFVCPPERPAELPEEGEDAGEDVPAAPEEPADIDE